MMTDLYDRRLQEIRELRELNAELLETLIEYTTYWGAPHEVDCPEDDTCHCEFKDFNDKVSKAIAKAEAMK